MTHVDLISIFSLRHLSFQKDQQTDSLLTPHFYVEVNPGVSCWFCLCVSDDCFWAHCFSFIGWWHVSLYYQSWPFPWTVYYILLSFGCLIDVPSLSIRQFSLKSLLSVLPVLVNSTTIYSLSGTKNMGVVTSCFSFPTSKLPLSYYTSFYFQYSLRIGNLPLLQQSRWGIIFLDYSDRCMKNRWLGTRMKYSQCTLVMVWTLPQILLQSTVPLVDCDPARLASSCSWHMPYSFLTQGLCTCWSSCLDISLFI